MNKIWVEQESFGPHHRFAAEACRVANQIMAGISPKIVLTISLQASGRAVYLDN